MSVVTSVSRAQRHIFTKPVEPSIRLLAGLGVEGDAHMGATVKHRWLAKKTPLAPNLCQVHLIHAELHEALCAAGFDVGPGIMGENITTRGLDLLALPRGARLHLGDSAIVEVTGLRDPCQQLNACRPGLMQAVLERRADGELIRKCGIMGIAIASGEVRPGDPITVILPPEPHEALTCV
jgi:MOSC domain-containing protein YiiM